MVGSRAGRWRRCTSSIRCGSAISAIAWRCTSSRDPKRLDSLAGLRILDIGCGGGILSEPLARLGASVVGADPSASNIAVAQHHAAQAGSRHRLPQHDGGSAGGSGRKLRRGAGHGSGRARRRCRPVRRARRRHGEARRPAVRRHAQSHHEKLCARHRRRRVHFALAAARHPSMGQVRHAQRARNRHRAERACRSPTRPA